MKTTLFNLTFLCLACLSLTCGQVRAQQWQWAKIISTDSGSLSPSGVSHERNSQIDDLGNLYISDNFAGNLNLGIVTLTAPLSHIFIAKYDPCGNIIWARQISSSTGSASGFLHLDSNKDVYLYCNVSGKVELGNLILGNFGQQINCIIKLNSDGNYLWHSFISMGVRTASLLSDSKNNLYLYGNMWDSIKFDNTTYPIVGISTSFLAKYNSNGVFQEVSFFPSYIGYNVAGYGIISNNDDIYLTGFYTKDFTIDGTLLQNSGSHSVGFLAIFKKNGQKIIKKLDIVNTSERITAIVFDENDKNLYIGGNGLIGENIPPIPFTFDNSFVVKMDTLGQIKWVRKNYDKPIIGINIENDNIFQVVFGTDPNFSITIPTLIPENVNIVCFNENNHNVIWEKKIVETRQYVNSTKYNLISNTNRSLFLTGILHYKATLTFDNIILSATETNDYARFFISKLSLVNIVADAGSDLSLCHRTQGQLGASSLPNYSYSWTPTEGLSNPNIANPTISLENNTDAPIVKQYILKASDITCPNAPLIKYDTVKITILPAYNALKIFTGSTIVCPNTNGTKYWVNAKANYDFTWSVAGGTIESGQGTDTIRVAWQGTNANAWIEVKAKHKIHGCETVFKLPVVIDKLLKPDKPIGEAVFCIEPDKVFTYKTSLLNNGSTYLWQTDDNTAILISINNQSEVKIRWTTAGIKKLWVTETNQTPCMGNSEVLEVNVLPTPAPIDIRGASPIPFFASQVKYEVQASAGSTYQWTLTQGGTITEGQALPAIRIDWEQEGEYLLTVQETNAQGCVGKPAEMRIKVVPFLPPNVITPNGDGKNDTWFLDYIANFPAHRVQIFDRAGKEVYQSNAYKNDWDAKNLPTDAYFYYLTLHPKIKPFKGTITVLR